MSHMPKPEHPTVEPAESPVADTVERHPAYAQISASRVQSTGSYLYGSEFKHSHFITITIRRSEKNRGLHRDWHHAREELIEVAMSESQWGTFISDLNSGFGGCCTLQRVDRVPVPQIASKTDRSQQFSDEMRDHLAGLRKDVAALKKLVDEGAGKRALRDVITRLENFTSNTGFIGEQFGEHMEDVVNAAKTELSAFHEGRLRQIALQAVAAGEQPSPSLPHIDLKELGK